jgi:uncharacterized protein UPF0047
MRISYRLSHFQHQSAQRHHPHHQRAPHALFMKVESRKVWPWYPPCTSLHRSSSGAEESGLHRDIMEWAEQLAPEHPTYRHHQTGKDNGVAHLKNLLLHHQVVLPITNGWIDFGRGPRLFYCEFDGQRTKRVIVKVI